MSSTATAAYFFSSTSALHELSLAHPRSNNGLPYSYGTSGFRGLAATLPSITVRMGVLAALRSLSTAGAASAPQSVGVMVTASHNEAPDNGVKLIDPSGEMMEPQWEQLATELANVAEQEVAGFCKQLALRLRLELGGRPARVLVGRDTRDSSPSLCQLVVDGASALGAEVEDFGVVTTPQLHWLVRERNAGRDATLDAYYRTLSSAFRTALEGRDGAGQPVKLPPLTVDCANGVGAIALQHLVPMLPQLPLTLINVSASSHLNDQCGAEHVQKTRSLPSIASASSAPFEPPAFARLASLDGDADRLVYCYVDAASPPSLQLMDGDKIISLYAALLSRLLSAAALTASIGIVQTAYANGASTRYLSSLGFAPVFTATGVKHLHAVAAQYEIGIYFEANGHGTVLFSPAVVSRAREAAADAGRSAEQRRAAAVLVSLVSLVNQGVGDAVSDLLLVETALYHLRWTLQDWSGIYADLPSSMLKVKVKDRSAITTTDAERRCVTPAGLQDEIDRLVGPQPAGGGARRAFVRPSGTEDVVRVYAEAGSRQEVDELAKQVCEAVARLAN